MNDDDDKILRSSVAVEDYPVHVHGSSSSVLKDRVAQGVGGSDVGLHGVLLLRGQISDSSLDFRYLQSRESHLIFLQY